MAQSEAGGIGFTQRPEIDYDETYSPIMSGITFRYLISMAANLNLKMQLMEIVTAYGNPHKNP